MLDNEKPAPDAGKAPMADAKGNDTAKKPQRLYCGVVEPAELTVVRKLRGGYDLTEDEREDVVGLAKPDPDAPPKRKAAKPDPAPLLRRGIAKHQAARRLLVAAGFTILDMLGDRGDFEDSDIPAPFVYCAAIPEDANYEFEENIGSVFFNVGFHLYDRKLRETELIEALRAARRREDEPADAWWPNEQIEAWAELKYKAWEKGSFHDPWCIWDGSKDHGSGKRRLVLAVPRGLMLGEKDGSEALAVRCPLAFPAAEIAALGEKVRWQPAALTALLESRRAAAGHRAEQHTPQMVSGLLLAGEVTVLIAEAGAGKSTLVHQMAASVASGAPHFLGGEIPEAMRGRLAVLLSAEEGEGTIARRIHLYAQHGLRGDVLPVSRAMGGLDDALWQIRDLPNLGVVSLDPARQWLIGKEDDSEVVSALLSKCQDFARATGASVVIVHHCKRRNPRDIPKTPQAVVNNMRGSQVFFDRPRAVWGMLRKANGTTELGVVKSNLAHAIPIHTRRLRFDPASEMYHAADGAAGAPQGSTTAPPAAAGPSKAETVAAVVARLSEAGVTVRKTGDRSLFAMRDGDAPELAGWSRGDIDGAVKEAIADGLLKDDRAAGLVVPG